MRALGWPFNPFTLERLLLRMLQALSTKDKLTYSMPLFRRGDPESVLLIKRKCNTGNLTAQQRCKRKVLVTAKSVKKAKSAVAGEDGDSKWRAETLLQNSEEEASGLTALCWLATQAIDARLPEGKPRRDSPWKQVRRHTGSTDQMDKSDDDDAAPWAVQRGAQSPWRWQPWNAHSHQHMRRFTFSRSHSGNPSLR